MNQDNRQIPIAFIGGGNMARALIAGLMQSGHAMNRVLVVEPNSERGRALVDDFGVTVKSRQVKGLANSALVVLAVKPQQIDGVVASLAPRLGECTTLLSIAAGISCARISAALGERQDIALVRTMPNTAAQVGSGVAALFSEAGELHRQRAEYLLRAVGVTLWVKSEATLHAVTALSGSGPAYFFLLTELMEASAVQMGLCSEDAALLASHTAYGAGRMLVEMEVGSAALRQQVTSPNGTTQAALDVMYNEGMPDIVRRALHAAKKRSKELESE
ncbi:MAG: pyrroline-5-carboxylate reductase [Mariprofundales bacterium]|nr:pyrroline-5-carboxylate reductase [Mariprofundales bacterium]